MAKRALITGVTGQDGAYLSQLLLEKDYEVFGVAHRFAQPGGPDNRLAWLGVEGRITMVPADLLDLSSLVQAIELARPDEIYNLAAQSSVGLSWQQPVVTSQVTGLGAINMLQATKMAAPEARFYQASSSEIFGRSQSPSQNEDTPKNPRSPYAAAKLYSQVMTAVYRESFQMHASSGILFNHESPLRGLEFVSRKISDAAARIKLGMTSSLALGNIDVRRDRGHARDYVRAMWLMLQQDQADDYVIASGRSTTVRDLCGMVFGYLGLDAEEFLVNDPALWRPADIEDLVGDASKAKRVLGWEPTVGLEEMMAEMVEADIARLRNQN